MHSLLDRGMTDVKRSAANSTGGVPATWLLTVGGCVGMWELRAAAATVDPPDAGGGAAARYDGTYRRGRQAEGDGRRLTFRSSATRLFEHTLYTTTSYSITRCFDGLPSRTARLPAQPFADGPVQHAEELAEILYGSFTL